MDGATNITRNVAECLLFLMVITHTSVGPSRKRGRMDGGSSEPGGKFQDRLQRALHLGADHPEPGVPHSVEAAADAVRSYIEDKYTGAAFDGFGENNPVKITSDDLIAVTMLSIHIREKSTSSLRPSSILKLDSLADQIADRLGQIPTDRELHTLTQGEFERWLGPGSPGDELYWLLRKRASMPRVAVYKLLARKRLLLMPIRDTVVERALGQTQDEWWRPWWEALTTEPEIVSRLAQIRQRSGAARLSLVRVADIVPWMTHQSSEKTTRMDST